jgi:hypothetical protein
MIAGSMAARPDEASFRLRTLRPRTSNENVSGTFTARATK